MDKEINNKLIDNIFNKIKEMNVDMKKDILELIFLLEHC